MTSKRYMSNKKTAQQTISISPSLKDWIQRYVNVMQKEHPEDERYKSTSAFYCHVMENILKTFQEGKSLDDFDRLVDKEYEEFFAPISAEFIIPFMETEVNMNRYSIAVFEENMRFLLGSRKIFMKDIDYDDFSTIITKFNRIKKRFMAAKGTKDMNLDLFIEKGKVPFRGILEHTGHYKNLHHINCKMMAASLGFMGFKIINLLYSEKEIYYRMEIVPTDLFFSPKLETKRRRALSRDNIEYVINYNRVLDDTDNHLWIKLANDEDVLIYFKNENSRDKWIEKIEKDLRKFGTQEEILPKLLRYFSHLHWIRFENEQDLSFKINISREKNDQEIEFMLNYLSKFSKINEKDGIFYLEKLEKI